MKVIKAVVLFSVLFVLTGCALIEYFREESQYPSFEATTNEVTGRQVIISPEGKRFQKISGRFNWSVPRCDDKDAKDKRFPHRIGRVYGGQVYETEEEYCLFVFVPEDSWLGGWYFDETFEFPQMKAEEFGEVVLFKKGEETILKDEACIQAFLDRLLTRKYDVKRESVETTDKSEGAITFYSMEHPKLYFDLSIYREKDQKKYHIVDRSNLDWIECTDIIEQYLSEYFE